MQRDFFFSRVPFNHDSYRGIGITVKYFLRVEMSYSSTLRKVLLVETKDLEIVNKSEYLKNSQDLMDAKPCSLIPQMRLTFTLTPGLEVDLKLLKTRVNIASESIEGSIRIKFINDETALIVQGFSLELVQ